MASMHLRGRSSWGIGRDPVQEVPMQDTDPALDRGRRRVILAGLAAGACTSTWARAASRRGPVIRTAAGRVRGFTDGDLDVFRGIRYGADTGPRRFPPPAPPAAWPGVFDARDFGPASPQTGSEPNQSEDCLFLNVVAPRAKAARPRPVIVYIHGGAYSGGSGSSPLYDGSALCRNGGVVV